jgi:hypothetical protein
MKISISQRLESWLLRGHSITSLQALDKWGCMRLSARVKELRDNGLPIATETVTKNGKSFAKYSIMQ